MGERLKENQGSVVQPKWPPYVRPSGLKTIVTWGLRQGVNVARRTEEYPQFVLAVLAVQDCEEN